MKNYLSLEEQLLIMLLCKKLKSGNWYKIRGYTKNDPYSKELVLNARDINELKKSIETARINGEESANVGLRNLARRLFLLYGEKAAMDIGSKNNSGFTVTLTIPIGRTNEQRIDCR